MASIDNWTAFLQSDNARRIAARQAVDDPETKVLKAVSAASLLPLTQLVKITSLAPEVALSTVEQLRKTERLEVVQSSDSGPMLLRLTPAGYSVLASLNVS